MAIISLVGHKGGCGKTTVAVALADEWFARGNRVLLVDAEPEPSDLTRWSRRACEHGHTGPDLLHFDHDISELWEAASSYEVTVIDCPRDPHTTRIALDESDLAIVPCGPSALEMDSLERTLELVREYEELRDQKKVMITEDAIPLQSGVLVVRAGSREAARTVREIKELGFDVFHATLDQRSAFPEAMAEGLGITRYAPRSRGAAQVRKLVDELERWLGVRAAPLAKRKRKSTPVLVRPAEHPIPEIDESETPTDVGPRERLLPLRIVQPPAPADLGPYRILERIDGHFGEAFLAQIDGRVVVLERPRSAAKDHVALIRYQAEIMATLDHPKIVRMQKTGELDGLPFIELEHVDGLSLLATLASCGRTSRAFPTDLALFILIELATALAYLHARGIVHGDLAPSNVLLSREGEVKLQDFSIATSAAWTRPRSGTLKRRFAYMSPEQADEKTVDARSDLFVIGILLYELLTGRRLFKGPGLVVAAVREARIDAPMSRYDVAPELERIALKALARDPADRFQSAESLGAALTEFLASKGAKVDATALGSFIRVVINAESPTLALV